MGERKTIAETLETRHLAIVEELCKQLTQAKGGLETLESPLVSPKTPKTPKTKEGSADESSNLGKHSQNGTCVQDISDCSARIVQSQYHMTHHSVYHTRPPPTPLFQLMKHSCVPL